MTYHKTKPRRDIAQEITNRIIAAIEAGTPPWKQPWAGSAAIRPIRSTGAPYTGVNVLILWDRASEMGFENPRWLSFKQAQALGGKVRKGERSVAVVYYGATTKTVEDADGTEAERAIRFLKHYNVFNVHQIEGLPEHFYEFRGRHVSITPPESERRAFFAGVGADIRHGGDRAFYGPDSDYIQMPPYGAFENPECYWSTLAHEHVHLTGHKTRLDRLKFPMSTEDRAMEECVAEIGSAILGAELSLKPDHIDSHAAYIGSWLKAMRGNKTYVLKAAAAAQRAADWLTNAAREGGYAGGVPSPDEYADDTGVAEAA